MESQAKGSSVLQELALTEPATPPLDPAPSPQTLIQRIISSNEELISTQMQTIRALQLDNAQLRHQLAHLATAHDTLLQTVQGDTPNAANLIAKVLDLEQELSRTKVEVAMRSEELLSVSFKNRQNDQRSRARTDFGQQELEKYFELRPAERNHEGREREERREKEMELAEQWRKLVETHAASELRGGEFRASRFKEKAAGLLKKGVPREVRGMVWERLVENRAGVGSSLYLHLLARREKGWVDEKVRAQIGKDIRRSFYGKTNYQTRTGLILEVVELLEIFHLFRPDVGYVQGMTYPAIILIPVMGKIRAFTLFANLLANPFFRRLFSLQAAFIDALCRGFEGLLQDLLPSLQKRLHELSLQSQIYLIEWLFTFCSRGLSFETTLRFWDHLLFHDELAIFRLALGVMEQLAGRVQQMSYEETVHWMREFGQHVSEDKLMESVASSKVTAEKLYKYLEKAAQKQ